MVGNALGPDIHPPLRNYSAQLTDSEYTECNEVLSLRHLTALPIFH